MNKKGEIENERRKKNNVMENVNEILEFDIIDAQNFSVQEKAQK